MVCLAPTSGAHNSKKWAINENAETYLYENYIDVVKNKVEEFIGGDL